MDAPRQCRACGCTSLSACETPEGACHWVEFDLCSGCATPEQRKATIPFAVAYPTPWRIQDREIVDAEGCHVNGIDYDGPDELEFWNGIVEAVNATGRLATSERTKAWNEGLIAGLTKAREIFTASMTTAIAAVTAEEQGRRRAYDLWSAKPEMGNVEAAARALCTAAGMDPDKVTLDRFGGEEALPLWRWREDEARAALEAAYAVRAPVPAELGERLADCLALVVDTPLLKVTDTMLSMPVELRVSAFQRDLAEHAAALLEEAGR